MDRMLELLEDLQKSEELSSRELGVLCKLMSYYIVTYSNNENWEDCQQIKDQFWKILWEKYPEYYRMRYGRRLGYKELIEKEDALMSKSDEKLNLLINKQ